MKKGIHWDHNGGYWRLGKHHGPSITRLKGHPTSFVVLRSKRHVVQFTRVAKHA